MNVYCCCALSPDTRIEPELPIPPDPVKVWQLEELKVHVKYPMELIKKNQPRFRKTAGSELGDWNMHERQYPNVNIYRCQYCGDIVITDA
jgi:hypothetical protein